MSCRLAKMSKFKEEDDNDDGDDINGENPNDLQATLAAYARRKFSSGEISTEHMRNIMKVPANMSINSIETNVQSFIISLPLSIYLSV